MEPYDSSDDTRAHIHEVQRVMANIMGKIALISISHDRSKLEPEEKPFYDTYTPLLKGLSYGTPEYFENLKRMKPALDHHYSVSRHHPEFHEKGVSGMNLLDVLEMFVDWLAATKRHDDGDIYKSIEINAKRFNLDPQLVEIFKNTADLLKNV